jgi:hypothetical protein
MLGGITDESHPVLFMWVRNASVVLDGTSAKSGLVENESRIVVRIGLVK